MPLTFVGVEIAEREQRERLSIAVTRGNAVRTYLVARAEGLTSLQRAAEFIVRHATANTIVAIDAPLVVGNQTGQRPCELELERRFGRAGVRGRAANLTASPEPAGVRFVDLLRWDGFRHDPRLEEPKIQAGRWLFEVRAHAAQAVLFGLDVLGAVRAASIAERRLALRVLQGHMRSLQYGMPRLEMTPALGELVGRDVTQLRGHRQIGDYRATLSALMCSYLAAHTWRWGCERNEMIGDLESGYVIVPTLPHTPRIDGQPIDGAAWGVAENGLNDND